MATPMNFPPECLSLEPVMPEEVMCYLNYFKLYVRAYNSWVREQRALLRDIRWLGAGPRAARLLPVSIPGISLFELQYTAFLSILKLTWSRKF